MINVDGTTEGTPLGSIDYTFDRIPLIVIIVKTCTLNGLGDMGVTLKVIKFNSISNDYLIIFGTFIHENLNFRILQRLLMSLCGGQSYKIKILANI